MNAAQLVKKINSYNTTNQFQDELYLDIVSAWKNDENQVKFFDLILGEQNFDLTNKLFWNEDILMSIVFRSWFKDTPNQVNFFFETLCCHTTAFLPYVKRIESFGCKFYEATLKSPVYLKLNVVEYFGIKIDEPSYFISAFIDSIDLYIEYTLEYKDVKDNHKILNIICPNHLLLKEYYDKLEDIKIFNEDNKDEKDFEPLKVLDK